jgi:tRNA threonylcarbamoyladenosine biosynthesis protein TsaE
VVPIAHLDLYRLESLELEDPALLDDYLGPEGVAFIEWPAIAAPVLADHRVLAVRLEHAGGDRRRIEMPAASARK